MTNSVIKRQNLSSLSLFKTIISISLKNWKISLQIVFGIKIRIGTFSLNRFILKVNQIKEGANFFRMRNYKRHQDKESSIYFDVAENNCV